MISKQFVDVDPAIVKLVCLSDTIVIAAASAYYVRSVPVYMQHEPLLRAIKDQAERVYDAWQGAAYRRTQQMAAQQEGSLRDFVRHTIKAAHFLELTQKWCASGSHTII